MSNYQSQKPQTKPIYIRRGEEIFLEFPNRKPKDNVACNILYKAGAEEKIATATRIYTGAGRLWKLQDDTEVQDADVMGWWYLQKA